MVLGIMAVDRIGEEQRIEKKLLAVSEENRGSGKQFDRIAGSLIGYVAREAIRSFPENPFVYLTGAKNGTEKTLQKKVRHVGRRPPALPRRYAVIEHR